MKWTNVVKDLSRVENFVINVWFLNSNEPRDVMKKYSRLNEVSVFWIWPVLRVDVELNVLYTSRMYVIRLAQYYKFVFSLLYSLLTPYEK